MDKRELICITCPIGCMMSVSMDGESIMKVEGNACSRGDAYARAEVTNPVRVVTSTVAIKGAGRARLSVKTKGAIPKDKISECMKEIKKIDVKSPINVGDIIIENVAESGINVVATSAL